MSLPVWTQAPLRIFGILSSRGVALVLQLALLAVVGRMLGVAGMGVYQLFVSWLMVIGILGAFGAPMQNLRDVAVASVAGDSGRVERVFWDNMKAAIIGVVVLALVLAVASPWMQMLVPDAGPSSLLLMAAAAAVLFAMLKTTVEALKGAGRPQPAIFFESGFVPATLLIGIGAVWVSGARLDSTMLLAGHLTALLLATTVAGIVWLRLPLVEGGLVDAPARNSRFVFGATQALGILASNLAILVMPLFLTAHAIGLFAAAQKLVAIATIILGTLSAYFAPRFSLRFARKDVEGLAKELRNSQVYSLALFLPIFILFLAFPTSILRIFGPEFSDAATLLVILATGQLLNSATGLAGFFLNMVHKEKQELASMTAGLLLLIALLAVWTPTHGVLGVAGAVAAFMIFKNIVALVFCLGSVRDFRVLWSRGTSGAIQ